MSEGDSRHSIGYMATMARGLWHILIWRKKIGPKLNKLLESLDENANGEMDLIGNYRHAIHTQLIVLRSEPHPLVDMEVF